MKSLSKFLSVFMLVLVASAFNSCEKKIQPVEEMGSFEFVLSLDESSLEGLKSEWVPDSTGLSPYHALLTVLDRDSMPVLEDELLPLYKFGDGFFSEKIELKMGHYLLVKFLIINPDGEVIFAAPRKGSPKAYLVKDPLPIDFKIKPEETTRLRPEVLPVNNEPPSEFGYASFGFSIVRPLPFFIGVMIDNPMIMDPAGNLAPSMFTTAALSVYHPDGWHHDFKLEARVNRVVIRGGARAYKFIIEKEGFEPVKMEVPAEKLKETSRENPMIVRIGPGMMVLRLQPGPENGKDAMISDLEPEKNFGKFPYFEATWKSDSMLTVMRERRSLIYFSPTGLPKSARIKKVILTLHYDRPIPWELDSLYLGPPISADGTLRPMAVLQQIVEPWKEDGVTWKTQPKSIEANQVFVPPFAKDANFINIDVTGFWVPMQEIAAPNYGMMFKLLKNDAVYFPGFRFASSDFREPKMRPMLKIYYTLPTM